MSHRLIDRLAHGATKRRLAALAIIPPTVVALALSTGGTSAASTAGQGRTANAAATIRAGEAFVPGQLLVRFARGTTPASSSAVNAAVGASTVKSFSYLVPHLQLVQLHAGVTVSSALSRYAQQAGVLYAQPNWISHIDGAVHAKKKVPNDPQYPNQWDWPKIDAPSGWAKSTGSSKVVVTDIDTGLDYRHEDLKANVWENKKECDGKKGKDDDGNGYVDDCHGIDTINSDSDPMDDQGHGTHTGGTIGAVGDNKTGVTGMNWTVQIMPCKSHDAGGSGSVASIVECYQYVKMEKEKYGYDIAATNNSYSGCPEACDYNPATYDAIKALIKPGVVMSYSAGNSAHDNDQQPNYPATYDLPNIITVASTDVNDNMSGFSQWGVRSVDVGAPGSSVLSTLPNNQYGNLSGTSMAAPHVAGLIGLLHAWQPKDDWYTLRNLLIAGGDPISALKGKTVSGRRINVEGSMTCKNQKVFGMLSPAGVTGSMRETVTALNIDCAKPAGSVKATVSPGNTKLTLTDDGKGGDLVKGDGIYSAAWTPPCKSDTYSFKFSSGEKYSVKVTACIKLSESSGKPGSSVKVSGSGYSASEVVDVFFDDVMLDTVNADSKGKLSATVKVPKDAKKGSHLVMASGQDSGVAATATFKVK